MDSMTRELKAATDYLVLQAAQKDLPESVLRQLIAERLRMLYAEALRDAANHLHGLANKAGVV